MEIFKWNNDSVKILKEYYPHFGRKYVSILLKTTPDVVNRKAKLLKIKKLPRDQRLCIECKTEKVAINKDNIFYSYGNKCIKCYHASYRRYYADSLRKDPIRTRISDLLKQVKSRSRKNKIKYDINIEYLMYLFKKQDGRCFYTGKKMIVSNKVKKPGSWDHDSLSLDRICPNKGYVKKNVVFCTFWVNTAKSNMSVNDLLIKSKELLEYTNVENIKNRSCSL